jgi:hypothetical protein
MNIISYKNLVEDKKVPIDTLAYYYTRLSVTQSNIERGLEKVTLLDKPSLDATKKHDLEKIRAQLRKEYHTLDLINTSMIAAKSNAKNNTNTKVTIYIDNRGHNPVYSK